MWECFMMPYLHIYGTKMVGLLRCKDMDRVVIRECHYKHLQWSHSTIYNAGVLLLSQVILFWTANSQIISKSIYLQIYVHKMSENTEKCTFFHSQRLHLHTACFVQTKRYSSKTSYLRMKLDGKCLEYCLEKCLKVFIDYQYSCGLIFCVLMNTKFDWKHETAVDIGLTWQVHYFVSRWAYTVNKWQ